MTLEVRQGRGGERALENSEVEFVQQYREYAASGTLYPQIEGSPLLEFSAGGRVLFLFDRLGPYAATSGPAQVIVHGQVDESAIERLPEAAQEVLNSVGISQVEGVGCVLAAGRRTVVVQARIPLVLSTLDSLPALSTGEWVKFRTQPPLHGFIIK